MRLADYWKGEVNPLLSAPNINGGVERGRSPLLSG